MTIIWCMVPEIPAFFVILDYFLPFNPPPILLQLRKSKFGKNEKNAWRYHHFTKMNGKWQSYHVWFLIYEAQQTEFFLSFWATCCPFTPLTNYKIKWKKKCLEILFYTTNIPKIMTICYTVAVIWCMTDVIFIFHFGLFLAPLPFTQPKKSTILKKWKKHIEISSFHTSVQKIMIRWTDEWTEKVA